MKENRSRAPFAVIILRAGAAALALACLALDASGAMQSGFGVGSSKLFAERVRAAGTGEYTRVLAEFDSRLSMQPMDAVAAVERCKFIDAFAYTEEETIESASDDSKECKEVLRNGVNANSGEVKTYLWLDTYGEDSIKEGEALLKEGGWTARQRSAIHEGLSDRYQVSDTRRAGQHAVMALELDSTSGMRLRAAEHYVRIGAKRLAASAIKGMPTEKWNSWTLETAVTTLLNLGEGSQARELVESRKDIDMSPAARVRLATALLAGGEEQAGRSLIEKITSASELPEHYGTQLEREIFDFQLRYGTKGDAAAAYRTLRDKGFDADAFARHRLALTAAHWTAPWRLTDLAGVFVLLVVVLYMCLLPLAVVLPIHYRSVVKQLRGFVAAPPVPESPWSLRSGWYALAVSFSVGTIALYLFSYSDFEAHFGGWFRVPVALETLSDDRALGRAVFWSSVGSLVLLLPLLRRSGIRAILFGNWSARKSIGTGIGTAILLMFVAGLFKTLSGLIPTPGVSMGTQTVRSLQGVYSVYGVIGLFACAALIVPTLEELIFRGVLLGSTARHIRFWAAAILQALVFVALHEDTASYPLLFVFALLGSRMALRSGGLLAPISMHAVNNAFAAMTILGLTRF